MKTSGKPPTYEACSSIALAAAHRRLQHEGEERERTPRAAANRGRTVRGATIKEVKAELAIRADTANSRDLAPTILPDLA